MKPLTPDEFYHTELAKRRAIWEESGNLMALFDAV
jgi:hypothetical protein